MTRITMISAAALIALTGAASAASHKGGDAMMKHDFSGTVVNQDPYLATLMGAALMSGTGDAHSGVMMTDGTVKMTDGTIVPRFPDVRGTRTEAGVTHSN